MGDATQLRQVIHNLLQNAQDALADRVPAREQPRIDLITEAIHYVGAEGATGTAVRLAIVDNGPGFAPKILSRAFEPYVTSKAAAPAWGLPMVKKIVDEHGGRIDVANRTDGSWRFGIDFAVKVSARGELGRNRMHFFPVRHRILAQRRILHDRSDGSKTRGESREQEGTTRWQTYS
jgi:nitrogen fixation/metabolism regulation signal transduction histidine kinase